MSKPYVYASRKQLSEHHDALLEQLLKCEVENLQTSRHYILRDLKPIIREMHRRKMVTPR